VIAILARDVTPGTDHPISPLIGLIIVILIIIIVNKIMKD
jgi:hypothetical protein